MWEINSLGDGEGENVKAVELMREEREQYLIKMGTLAEESEKLKKLTTWVRDQGGEKQIEQNKEKLKMLEELVKSKNDEIKGLNDIKTKFVENEGKSLMEVMKEISKDHIKIEAVETAKKVSH